MKLNQTLKSIGNYYSFMTMYIFFVNKGLISLHLVMIDCSSNQWVQLKTPQFYAVSSLLCKL